MANEIKIIQTMTGDIFQPVRLYYQMHRKSGVLVAFNKLHCMSFDEPGDRWIWLYDGEAKKLKFKQSYASLPPHRRPIVLGSFYSRDDSQMYLDLGSIERAVAAAEFFDKHIKRTVAELKYVAIYNKIISEDEHPGACFDTLFASVNPADIDGSSEERLAMAIAALESDHAMDIINQRGFELVEAFPANYYEDGVSALSAALGMRQSVALVRLKRDPDYCMADLIRDVVINDPCDRRSPGKENGM